MLSQKVKRRYYEVKMKKVCVERGKNVCEMIVAVHLAKNRKKCEIISPNNSPPIGEFYQ